MALDFDEFPLDDKLVTEAGDISNVWRGSMSTFFQSLIGYLSQFGLFVPKLTTEQQNSIQSPEPGQFIYNTTTDHLLVFKPLPTGWVVVA